MGLIKKITRRLNGTHKLEKQYNRSINEVNYNEAVALGNLEKEFIAQRDLLEKAKKQEFELCQEEKALGSSHLTSEQAKREEAFQTSVKKIKESMQFIRAALEACRSGDKEIVEILFKKEQMVRSLFFNLHPLHIAAEHNQIEIIRLLCKEGVNIHRVNSEKESAADVAMAQGHMQAFNLIEHISEVSDRILSAAKNGNQTEIEEALKEGDINATNLEGYSALQLTIIHHHEATALFLISKNADIHVLDPEGYSLIQLAIIHQHSFKIIYALIQAGGDLSHQENVSKKTAADLASDHPDSRVKTCILERTEELKEMVLAEPIMHYQGPHWEGFSGPISDRYYATLKSRFVKVNGEQQLFIMARLGEGIQLKSYNESTKTWIDHPRGPEWSDNTLWQYGKYASTIQWQVMQGEEGQEKLYILGRNRFGIELWCYEPNFQKWSLCEKGPAWSDSEEWDFSSYSNSIRSKILKTVEGKEFLFLLGRHKQGINLWSYNPILNQWKEQASGPDWTVENGWWSVQTSSGSGGPDLYSDTIQLQAIQTADGQQKLCLLGQNLNGLQLWHYNFETDTWKQALEGPQLALNFDITHRKMTFSYSLQTKVLKIKGEEHLCLMTCHNHLIEIWTYNPNLDSWAQHQAYRGDCSDGWKQGSYWSDRDFKQVFLPFRALRLQKLEGYHGTDGIVVFNTHLSEIVANAYSFESRVWQSMALPNKITHSFSIYSMVHIHLAEINYKNQIFVWAKNPMAMECWSSRINLDFLQNQLTSEVESSIVGPSYLDKIEIFLEKISELSTQFLKASQNGNWLEAQQYLKQGAYINAVDGQGFNALQKSIMGKTLSIELLNGLRAEGIEIHSLTGEHSTLALVEKHSPHLMRHLIQGSTLELGEFSQILNAGEEMKSRFDAHCSKAQQFLNKYPTHTQKIQAMLAYYHWIGQRDPYALYVFPSMLILSQLMGTLENAKARLPLDFLKHIPDENILEAAQTFFKRTRAMHCLLNEQPHLKPPFEGFDYVVKSQTLKKAAIQIAEIKGMSIRDPLVVGEIFRVEMPLLISGTANVLDEFITQVVGLHHTQMTDFDGIAKDLLIYQANFQEILKAYFNKLIGKEAPAFIQEASKNDLIDMPPKLTLKNKVMLWQETHQEMQIKSQNENQRLLLKAEQEKETLNEWLTQREKEYSERVSQLNGLLKMFETSDSEVVKQYGLAQQEIRAHFHQMRADLSQNYHQNKKKAKKKFIKNIGAIVVASIVAPHLAASISKALATAMGITTASTAATVTLMVEGALIGSLSATFSGRNSRQILKDGFMGGWMAGFGSVMGNMLKTSTTVQRMDQWFKSESTLGKLSKAASSSRVATHAIVSGLKAAVYTGMEGGHLTDNLLLSIGNTVALGSVQNIGFVGQLNEKLTSAVVSAAVTSLITRSNLLDNAASIGLATMAQTAGDKIGNSIMDHRAQLKASSSKERPQPVNEEAHHKKQFSKILKKTSREASDWLSGRGIKKSPLEIEAVIQKENALQGQYSEVKAKLTALGNVEGSSLSELNALSKGFQKVVMSALEKMVSPTSAGELSPLYSNGKAKEQARDSTILHVQDLQMRCMPLVKHKKAVERKPEGWRAFGEGVMTGVALNEGILWASKIPVLSSLAKGLGWAWAGRMAVSTLAASAQFEHEYFSYTSEFDDIMQNPLISNAKKDQLWDLEDKKDRLTRLNAAKKPSLWEQAKTHPKEAGLILGQLGSMGMALAGNPIKNQLLSQYNLKKAANPMASSISQFSETSLVTEATGYSKNLRLWSDHKNSPLPNSMADGLRLKAELAFREAGHLNAEGELTRMAIESSNFITLKNELGNPKVIKELTKNGCNLSEWAKHKTDPKIELKTGHKAEIHFYYNQKTREVNYTIDYKIKGKISPFNKIIQREPISSPTGQ